MTAQGYGIELSSNSQKKPHYVSILGDSRRIPAFDIARGLAILGMFTAHMLTLKSSFPQSLIGISHGRSAALFAFLAGISLGIIAGRTRIPTGLALLQARMRVVTRALILLVIVAVLSFYNMNIILILGFYAAWFLFALPFLGWSARRLLILAGSLIFLGVPLSAIAIELIYAFTLQTTTQDSAAYVYLVSGTYGGAGFLGYIFTGLALARMGIASDSPIARSLAKKTLAVGFTMLLMGAGGATLADSVKIGHLSSVILGISATERPDKPDAPLNDADSSKYPSPKSSPAVFPPETGELAGKNIPADCFCDFPTQESPVDSKKTGDTKNKKDLEPPSDGVTEVPDSPKEGWQSPFPGIHLDDFTPDFWYHIFLDGTPHSNSLLETLGNLGFSLVIMSLFLLGGRKLATVLFPLATMGSMALTIYCLHVFWYTVSSLANWPQLLSFGIMICCFTVFSCVWKATLNRGPLERLLHWASHRSASISTPMLEQNQAALAAPPRT